MTHPNREDLSVVAVLEALASPVRLRILERLAAGEALTCSTVLPDVPPSSASHHWRVLREAGVLFARREGRIILHTLRRDDLDGRFPGLLDAVLMAARDIDPHGGDRVHSAARQSSPTSGPNGPAAGSGHRHHAERVEHPARRAR